MVSCEPTGMVSRRPLGRSAAATQTRWSPWRRHSCADSPVMSRSLASTGPADASNRSSPAAADSSERRGPSTNRPCMSRATNRWCSRATASRCAVGRARPVPATRPASVAGPASRAASTRAALSRTPTPLELSIYQYCRLRSWDARVRWVRKEFVAGSMETLGLGEGRGAVGKTLAEKVWDEHVVRAADGEPDLLYIDLHLIHEVTSPQAFDGLRLAGRRVRRPDLTIATEDHNVPTIDWDKPIADPVSRTQVETLRRNAEEFGVRLHPLGDLDQGIVHIIGPQLGLTQPGMTIVCGDSHTSTHGAFGALAFGIGTSEVEHVLATQTLMQARPKTMAVTVNGALPEGVTAKDLVLTLITHTGTGGGQGYVVEYRGPAIEALSMEGRMTVCNMSIEWGAKAGLIAPDQKTFDYLEGRKEAPKGEEWDAAVAYWRTLVTDDDATYDEEIVLDASTMTPFVTWGPNPGQGVRLGASVPGPADFESEGDKIAAEKALEYMGLEAGTPMRDIKVDTVFVGSCTNGRIEDLRAAASIIEGRHVAADTRLLVVPGSVRVRLQAEDEGLDLIFKEAGAEWRGAGCSMCLGMNPDTIAPGERSASTSNRNFEGRQGKGGRTHLVSVPVAAATAVRGTLSSPADLQTVGSN